MKTVFLLYCLICCLIVSGCTSAERYTDSHYPPSPVGHIEVVDLHQIQHQYTIIGNVQGYGVGTNVLRKKAAELGADAISIPVFDANGVSTAQAIKYKN